MYVCIECGGEEVCVCVLGMEVEHVGCMRV